MSETDDSHLERPCRLTSSSGRCSFAASILERLPAKDGRALLRLKILLRGDFWDRAALEGGNYSDDPVEGFCVTLPQVMVGEGAVQTLLLYLRQWLTKPMSFTVDLSGSKGQTAKTTFDGEGNSVLSAHHPTFSFEGAAAGMPHLEVSFETDESCIRLFYQQLSRALEDLGY